MRITGIQEIQKIEALSPFAKLFKQIVNEITYLLGWDHDTNLLDSLGKFVRLDSAVSIQVKVLE